MAPPSPRAALKPTYPYYLANKAAAPNADLEVIDKYTQQVATRIARADEAAVRQAIDAAVAAQPAMAALAGYERKEVLLHVARQMNERLEELAMALCIEAGKPIKDARLEIVRAIDTFTVAAEEAVRLYGEYLPLDISKRARGFSGIVRRFPNGPVAMISPFNFPMNLAAHKVAPAIAAGCTFILKPASYTPVSSIIMGDILAQTALPPGAFSILPCSRAAGNLLNEDDRIKVLSFTGSPSVGYDLMAKCGKKKCVLELGGNAACIVDGDADIEAVTERLVFGAFYQSGQSCISVQRVFVHESIYERLRDTFVRKVTQLKKGDPQDEDVFIGPIISEGDAKRLEAWVNNAVARGAKVLCGGKREGVFYDATIVENVPKDTELNAEEVFGTVCTIAPYSDFKKVIEQVNDSKFGLQAGVFTHDLNKAFYAYEHLEVGGVVIGDVPSVRIDSMPYGGVKESGLGREGVRYAIEDMTEIRIMLLKNVAQL
eukprot:Unigene3275_Nuclearia_a/m.10036 Unigene3275_Nuclearia_a/g.10036  ORF Unigene3275_Nuclearia_a/g.10036 Unigene3275_Nuclearia_a/m.10036 type:complete len:487 (+) Unigene3275_Nuclearia_a:94-1554(+)